MKLNDPNIQWETISHVRRYAVETAAVHTTGSAARADATNGKGKSGSSSSICTTYGILGRYYASGK